MSDLPPGWANVTLGEIAETRLGKMLSAKARTGPHPRPYLRNKNVQWGKFDLSDVLEMDFDANELERFQVRSGDLLICEGGEIGRAAIWRGQVPWIGYQKALHRVRPVPGVSADFLMYAFRWLADGNRFEPFVTGSTIKHLPQEDLRRLPLPLPPVPEQRRIVAAIEERFSRLDAAEVSLSRAARHLRLLSQGVVDTCVAAEERNTVLESVLAEPLINGRSVPTADEGFPVLRLTALRDGRVDLHAAKIGAWTHADAEPFLVREGDFLIARGNGSRRLVGRGGLVEGAPPLPVAFPDTIIRARVDPSVVRRRYLRLVWDTRLIRDQIESQARTTAGIYKINQAILRAITLPLPPIDEQDAVILRGERNLISIRVLESKVAQARKRANALRRGILEAAFGGALTQQDRADEPASALLDRIAADRAAVRKSRRRMAA